MKGPPLGPGGEDITWPNQVAPRGQKASSTRKIKTQNPKPIICLSLTQHFTLNNIHSIYVIHFDEHTLHFQVFIFKHSTNRVTHQQQPTGSHTVTV